MAGRIVARAPGRSGVLEWDELPERAPGPGEALIRQELGGTWRGEVPPAPFWT